ncbi:MAG: hypothetical protein LUD22_00520, partial [Coprobacillus sp.]|nr:hypothetical protein [Coprobacillus sp.]
YIQGGRAAVRNRASNLIIRDTVINGGAYANLLISSSCNVTLENVTTNQYVTEGQYEGETGVMGFGVLVEQQGDGSNITIIGDLKQYNWISEEDTKYFDYSFEHDSYTSLSEGLASVFETYKNYEYEDEDHVMELNTGILGLDADFTVDFTQITDGIVYHEITIINELWASLAGYTVDASATSENYIFTDFEFNPSNILDYGVVEPYFHWNLESDENERGTTFVYNADTKLVTITIAVGDSEGYTWIPAITITKYGIPLDYTLTMDETKDVKEGYTFTSEDEGDHYIVAEYDDEYNYKHNGLDEADVESYTLSYSETLHISVIVEVETTKHAEFEFTSNDGLTTYDTKVIDIGFDHYVTIDNDSGKYNNNNAVVEYNPTDDNGDPLTDENGEVVTLYAPKEYSDTSGTVQRLLGNLYWYYPVLTTITVYDWEGGVSDGAPLTYDRNNTTKSGLFSFGDETPFDVLTPSSNYWSGPYDVETTCTFTTNNSVLCIQSYVRNYKNSYSAQEFIGEFTYTDEAGQIFHYGIDYYRAAHTPS